MKKNTAFQNLPPVDVRQVPLHDKISDHARQLWEKYGRPAGRDEEIWLEAERQLLGVDPKVRKVGDKAVAEPMLARRAS